MKIKKKIFFFFWGGGGGGGVGLGVRVDVNEELKFLGKFTKKNWGGGEGVVQNYNIQTAIIQKKSYELF